MKWYFMFKTPDMRNSVILQQSDCLVRSIYGCKFLSSYLFTSTTFQDISFIMDI